MLLERYGIIKERFSALVTDAIRARLLEQAGYNVQVLEFIDMEGTPKNLLIRAVKKESTLKECRTLKERSVEACSLSVYDDVCKSLLSELGVQQSLYNLLQNDSESV